MNGYEIMDYYEKLYHHAIEQLCRERQQHEHEIVETTVKQIELQPLKPDSAYRVKFQNGSTLNNVNEVIKWLNEQCKDKNIVFVPSCDYFEIVEDK